jgi:hypothetical protein
VIGLLCRTPNKESRHELLRRVAAGGGVFKSENGTKVHIPGANLNDIANQADDLLEVIHQKNLYAIIFWFTIQAFQVRARAHTHILLYICRHIYLSVSIIVCFVVNRVLIFCKHEL